MTNELGRRNFLKIGGGIFVLGAPLPVLGASSPVAPGQVAVKSVWLKHQNTGAEGVETFWRSDTGYDQAALRRLDWFFRDWREAQAVTMNRNLYELIYTLQYAAKFKAPLEVLSGYRSPKTNEMLRHRGIGAARDSQHLYGRAVDLRVQGYDPKTLGRFLRELGAGGVGEYPTFVHCDTWKVRFWWSS